MTLTRGDSISLSLPNLEISLPTVPFVGEKLIAENLPVAMTV